MTEFETKRLPADKDVIAPDGSEIRILPALKGGSMAHVTLPPGGVSLAVAHKTVEEIWYILGGQGEMWRKQNDREEVVPLKVGVSVTIPLGTHFQFRCTGTESLTAILITMPPWPGEDEAYRVPDYWPAK